jgi:Family of unknown function (DUF6516)
VNARDYYLSLQAAIQAAPQVISSTVRFEEIDANEGYLNGVIELIGGFELHLAEYFMLGPAVDRVKYRYHLQAADGRLVGRWDNAPHHPGLATYPHHRHDAQDVVHPSEPMGLPAVLEAVLPLILPSDT